MARGRPAAKTRTHDDPPQRSRARPRHLTRAHDHARRWRASLAERPVSPRVDADAVATALGRDLPDGPTPAEDVIDQLATACEPGLTAMPSGRFFGFVIGGSQPAALAADWLVGAWDQNTVLRKVTPAVAAVEEVAAAWFLELLGTPRRERGRLRDRRDDGQLHRARGRTGHVAAEGRLGPRPRARRLATAARARRPGAALLGRPRAALPRPAGRRAGRRRRAGADRPRRTGTRPGGRSPTQPTIVLLQAGNLHSGACDPFDGVHRARARARTAWVHVDGAFGLWAAASPVVPPPHRRARSSPTPGRPMRTRR